MGNIGYEGGLWLWGAEGALERGPTHMHLHYPSLFSAILQAPHRPNLTLTLTLILALPLTLTSSVSAGPSPTGLALCSSQVPSPPRLR